MNILIVEGNAGDVELLQRVIENVGADSRVLITTKDLQTSVELLKKNADLDIIYLSSAADTREKIRILQDLKISSPIIHRKATAYGDKMNPNFVELFIHKEASEEGGKLKKAEAIFDELNRILPAESGADKPPPLVHPAMPKQRFMIRSPNKLRSITTQEIAYFYADKKLNFIRTWDNNRLIADFTIEELARLLDPSEFFRINRSLIISYKSIRDIHVHFGSRLKLMLNPPMEEDVYVSRDKVYHFRKWIGEGA